MYFPGFSSKPCAVILQGFPITIGNSLIHTLYITYTHTCEYSIETSRKKGRQDFYRADPTSGIAILGSCKSPTLTLQTGALFSHGFVYSSGSKRLALHSTPHHVSYGIRALSAGKTAVANPTHFPSSLPTKVI